MIFSHRVPIANSRESSWYWSGQKESFTDFPNTEVYGGKLDFSMAVDYFDIDSDTAERLRKIGEPFDIFNNPVQIAIPAFVVNVFKGINDEDGIGSLLWRFTNPERERQVYGIYASFYHVVNSIYCALTICYVDKDWGSEQPAAILEIGEDEGPFINPILINEEAADLFSFEDMQAVGEYLANVWFGIQYELVNCPEEIRVVEQRGPIEPNDDYHEGSGIVYVKRVIPVDEHGNPIKYEATNSGKTNRMPAWGVRGYWQTRNGKPVYVRPHPKGPERNNQNAFNPKQYVFDDRKIEADSE